MIYPTFAEDYSKYLPFNYNEMPYEPRPKYKKAKHKRRGGNIKLK